MTQPPNASFALDNYRITRFNYYALTKGDTFNLDFQLRGEHNKAEMRYNLTLTIKVMELETGKQIIDADIESTFSFTDSELPSHFYNSAMAIIYPYIRAYVSSLTIQANADPIILPLLNMTQFGDMLKENTVTI